MKSKTVKSTDLEALRAEFASTEAAFLVEFRGLKVVDVDDLRTKVRGAAGSYRVVKNTLARAASEGTGMAGLRGHFTGPTAIVTAREDIPSVAKVLAEFAKTNPALTLKAGLVEGSILGSEECREIASMPSREELQSKLAYLLQSPLRRLAVVLQAPSRNLAVVLAQVSEKRAAEGA